MAYGDAGSEMAPPNKYPAKKQESRFSRRRVSQAAVLGTAGAVAAKLGGALRTRSAQAEPQDKQNQPLKNVGATLIPSAVPPPEETPQKPKPEVDYGQKDLPIFYYYKNDSERKQARKEVEEQELHIRRRDMLFLGSNTRRTLEWKNAVLQTVQTYGFNAPLPAGFSVEDALLGLIFVESKGEENPGRKPTVEPNDNSARGLCQIKQSTAREIAEKFSMSFDRNSLLDPRRNIFYALKHLEQLVNTYSDPTLALWGYHFGDGNLVNVIEVYSKSLVKTDEEKNKIDTILSTNSKEPGTAKLVKEYGINFMKVMNSPAVIAYLRNHNLYGEKGDFTELYVPRIAAASKILNS